MNKLLVNNKIPYKDFKRIIPHPDVVQALLNRYPVVIQGVDGIGEKRL